MTQSAVKKHFALLLCSDVEKAMCAAAAAPRKQFGSVSASSVSKMLKPKQMQELMDESTNNTADDSDSSLSCTTFPCNMRASRCVRCASVCLFVVSCNASYMGVCVCVCRE